MCAYPLPTPSDRVRSACESEHHRREAEEGVGEEGAHVTDKRPVSDSGKYHQRTIAGQGTGNKERTFSSAAVSNPKESDSISTPCTELHFEPVKESQQQPA